MNVIVAVALCTTTAVYAAEFEVASIRPNRSPELGRQGGLFREHINTSEGRVTLRNISLQACIKWAYGMQDPQIVGPDWLKVERYDIAAKASGPATEEALREMLRTLLADRFGLVVRRETRNLPAVILSVGSSRPELKQATGYGPGYIRAANGKIVATNATMAELAVMLSDPLRAPVLDQTGLGDRYDFTLDFTAFAPAAGETPDEASITASIVRQQLGLQLLSRRAQVSVLIVEAAKRQPTEN